MFLEPIERTDTGNEYQSYFLVPRRDGSIDVTHSGLIAEKARKYVLSGHLGISSGVQIWA